MAWAYIFSSYWALLVGTSRSDRPIFDDFRYSLGGGHQAVQVISPQGCNFYVPIEDLTGWPHHSPATWCWAVYARSCLAIPSGLGPDSGGRTAVRAGPVWHTALGALGVVIELALGCHQLQPLSDGGVGLGLLYPFDGTYPMGPASGPFGFANCSLVSPMSRIRRRLRIRTFGIPRVPHAAACFLALILGFQIQRRDGRHDFTTHGTIWCLAMALGIGHGVGVLTSGHGRKVTVRVVGQRLPLTIGCGSSVWLGCGGAACGDFCVSALRGVLWLLGVAPAVSPTAPVQGSLTRGRALYFWVPAGPRGPWPWAWSNFLCSLLFFCTGPLRR